MVFLIFSSSNGIAQAIGNVGEYFSNNQYHKIRNICKSFYNLNGEISEVCEWSYQLDDSGAKYNLKEKSCFVFNENHEVVKRKELPSSSGKVFETKYKDYRKDEKLSIIELAKNGSIYNEQLYEYENSVNVALLQKSRNQDEYERFDYEITKTGDSLIVNDFNRLNYYKNGKLVKRISGSNIYSYSYNSKGALELVNVFRNDRLVKKDSFNTSGLLVLRLKSEFERNGNFNYGYIESFEYENSKIVGVKRYNRNGEQSYMEDEVYLYDSNNRLIEVRDKNNEDALIEYQMSYNAKGDLTNYDGSRYSYRFRNHTYDKQGNWIYREKIDGNVKRYEEREFVYYK